MIKGLLVVIEGIDGSGKTTQIELLTKYLKQKNIPYQVISFPRYEDNLYGQIIKRYLEGEFGAINNVDPYLISLAYAGDRLLAKSKIEDWLSEGKIVIANRYVSSNKAHQGANVSEDKREEFIKWLDQLEYENNSLPKEDLTILLNVDPKVGQENTLSKNHPDIHEENLIHLEEANKIYLSISESEQNWVVVDCMENGQMRSRENIHQDIIKIIAPKII